MKALKPSAAMKSKKPLSSIWLNGWPSFFSKAPVNDMEKLG